MNKFVIHAGHGPSGGLGQGAVGILNESDEARNVVQCFKDIMHDVKADVVDVTVNKHDKAANILTAINSAVKREQGVTLAISVHLNMSPKHNATGTEVYCWDGENGKSAIVASRISAAISNALGIRDRGVKNGNHLSVIKNVAKPSLLIECCFCDSIVDVERWSVYDVAEAIAEVLINYYNLDSNDYVAPGYESSDSVENHLYRVQVGAFSNKMNAEIMAERLRKAGFDTYIYKEDK